MEVGMEFARRPEELAKPEGVPERPPTPGPEKQLYDASNISAVATNEEARPTSLPPKAAFSVSTPPVVEHLTEAPLQPVQEIHPDSLPRGQGDQSPPISHMDYSTTQNGGGSHALPTTNGAPAVEVNGKLSSPQPSNHPHTEVTTADPAVSSSLPVSASFDSFAPSTTHVDTQNTVTTIAPPEPLESIPDLQSAPEQASTSSIRTSPQPLPPDSEAAFRIKTDRHQQDLANDSELAHGLEVGGKEPIERTLTPPPPPTVAQGPTPDSMAAAGGDEQSVVTSAIDTDAASLIPLPPAVTDIPLSSPPPAPELAHATLPAEQPPAPAPTPVEPHTMDQLETDQPMMDAPTATIKVSRERDEEDDGNGPAAKRLKAEAGQAEPDFKVPDAPVHSPPAEQHATGTDTLADDTVTVPRLVHMKRVIANLKKSQISTMFREPVDPERLKIPTYFDVVKQPMDLGTVDRRLKSSSYQTVSDFLADFNLIVDNALAFNGAEHAVSETALKMRRSFQNQMKALPPASFVAIKDEKKTAKAKEHPLRTTQRRTSTAPAPAASSGRSPVTPGSAQTFALGPEGVPLIRRDSTAADGRPKRAIHPPKRRDQDLGPGRPRKKKFEWQLKFCREVVAELKRNKHTMFGQYFYHPVDAVALNIPTYHKIIKKPMDLETVEKKLDSNQYERAKDFEDDVRQIFKNCYAFNQQGDYVYTCGQQFELVFDEKWATKDEWLASHEPASEPQSAGEDEEEEGSEEEDDESADERNGEIAQLKAQIAMMSQTIGNLQSGPKKKKKNTPPVPAATKKSSKSKKKDKPTTTLSGLQPTSKEKKKAATKSKSDKEHFVTYNEKQYISTGISSLPDARMSEALKIIQSNVPSLKHTHETEIELDIDELPNHVLLKLLNFVKKYGENAPPEPEPPQEPSYAPVAAPGKPKKNKPMSKQEQEQQIQELKGKLGAYNGGPISPDAAQSVERALDSSGDDDSEESEEE